MFATQKWADELTKQAAGKHHIGDFLPPEELKKYVHAFKIILFSLGKWNKRYVATSPSFLV